MECSGTFTFQGPFWTAESWQTLATRACVEHAPKLGWQVRTARWRASVANKKHVALLKQGAQAWNAWRREHPMVCPDLFGATLFGADLSKADLREANLRGADLSYADLRGADLSDANLAGADLYRATLSDANLTQTNLSYANLRGTGLSEADLTGSVGWFAGMNQPKSIESQRTSVSRGCGSAVYRGSATKRGSVVVPAE